MASKLSQYFKSLSMDTKALPKIDVDALLVAKDSEQQSKEQNFAKEHGVEVQTMMSTVEFKLDTEDDIETA